MNRPVKYMALINNHDGERVVKWHSEFFSDMSPVTGYGSEFPDPNDPDVTLYEFTGLLDKIREEIYEGHKIRSGMTGLEYEIIWDITKARFTAKPLRDTTILCVPERWSESCRIIGHITDKEKTDD
ncbi:MAG: hypothetical protein KAR06_01365 [Deltaproteobacteria bacterium]|nr:hypothetical protein [Deltaproteobacteria bacterium]